MSTKCSVAYGDNFHLYNECFDDSNIYLELDSTDYEVSYGRVIVKIPNHIWEVIRRRGEPRNDWRDKTDQEIEEQVVKEVDTRTKECPESIERIGRASIYAICGSIGSISWEDPREEQIQRGIELFKSQRKFQQEMWAKIEELEKKQRQ